jgi:pyruvate, water dikinase
MPLINRFQKNNVSSYPVRFRYEALRSLMNGNIKALKILGDLSADLNHIRYSDDKIKEPVQRLIHQSFLMAQELNLLTSNRYDELFDVLSHIQAETERIFTTLPDTAGTALALSLDSEDALDHRQTGGKASLLARLRKQIPAMVPEGFVITAQGYDRFLAVNGLDERIRLLVHNLDMGKDQNTFSQRTRTIREWIMQAEVPSDILEAICANVRESGVSASRWAVRASAVDEDLAHSFASQFETVLNASGTDLADAYRRVLASRFSDQAVSYRIHHGFREVKTPMVVLLSISRMRMSPFFIVSPTTNPSKARWSISRDMGRSRRSKGRQGTQTRQRFRIA